MSNKNSGAKYLNIMTLKKVFMNIKPIILSIFPLNINATNMDEMIVYPTAKLTPNVSNGSHEKNGVRSPASAYNGAKIITKYENLPAA